MDEIQKNYLLIIVGIVAIILELLLGVATGFDLLLMGVILIISGGFGAVTESFTNALIAVTMLTLLYIFIGRKFVRKELSIKTHETNIDSLIEKKAVVIKTITASHPGQVKVEGEIWRAASDETLDKGKTVTIKSVSGVTLEVS